MKRLFDLVLALIAACLLIVPIVVVAVLVKLTSEGPALYWSDRVGMHNTIFKMPKFRSMKVETPAVATHLLVDPGSVLTSIGDFLRQSSLDELPQLWCILKGEMSFAARLIGKGDVANRLFGSLQVDSSKARDLLGWKPVITMGEELKKTVAADLKNETTL